MIFATSSRSLFVCSLSLFGHPNGRCRLEAKKLQVAKISLKHSRQCKRVSSDYLALIYRLQAGQSRALHADAVKAAPATSGCFVRWLGRPSESNSATLTAIFGHFAAEVNFTEETDRRKSINCARRTANGKQVTWKGLEKFCGRKI